MKKFFIVFFVVSFFSTNSFAEYRMEPVTCTGKKIANCGAYLYDSNTGATYFCNSEKCKQVMEAMEDSGTSSLTKTKKKSFKSKIPKKKKKSKIPRKPKKTN